VAFGWKGGIGTASRRLPPGQGGWTIGVLVQSNFGGDLTIAGVPVGRELRRRAGDAGRGDGSIIIVVATDAPLDHRRLGRLAWRAFAGLARTGSSFSNGSGDYVIAFSTARGGVVHTPPPTPLVPNDSLSPLFQAAIEATEEAIVNSLFRAGTVSGHRGTAYALPIDSTISILNAHGAIRP